MTYNFDPDRWYEVQRTLLADRHHRGDLDDAAFATALEELDERYEELIKRLDGTFEIPPPRSPEG